MARWRQLPSDAPEKLVRLVVSEWRGLRPLDAFERWKSARRAWSAERGFRTLDGTPYPDPRPDGPLGDLIDQLRAEMAARKQPAVWEDVCSRPDARR